jgi:hypothetical protein
MKLQDLTCYVVHKLPRRATMVPLQCLFAKDIVVFNGWTMEENSCNIP